MKKINKLEDLSIKTKTKKQKEQRQRKKYSCTVGLLQNK